MGITIKINNMCKSFSINTTEGINPISLHEIGIIELRILDILLILSITKVVCQSGIIFHEFCLVNQWRKELQVELEADEKERQKKLEAQQKEEEERQKEIADLKAGKFQKKSKQVKADESGGKTSSQEGAPLEEMMGDRSEDVVRVSEEKAVEEQGGLSCDKRLLQKASEACVNPIDKICLQCGDISHFVIIVLKTKEGELLINVSIYCRVFCY